MENLFLKIPIKFDDLIKKKDLVKFSLQESIAQNIYLIITTSFGESRYDYDYGCELWDLDFELIPSLSQWKDKVQKSLEKSISVNETRIYEISVSVDISEQELLNGMNNGKRIKRRLNLSVKGKLTSTSEDFNFSISLYMNPISFN